jgi:hypothetical protein
MNNFSRFVFPVEVTSPVFTQPLEFELVAVFKFQPFIKGDREAEDVQAELIIDRIEPNDLVPCDLAIALAAEYHTCADWDELRDSIKKDG